MDLTNRYRRLDKGYILRLVFIVLTIIGVNNSQKTYMRSCDCEYFVDGKCAYTLLLPVQNSNSPNQNGPNCPNSVAESNSLKEQSTRLDNLESTLDLVQTNLSNMEQMTVQNAQLLLDVQSKVISLQHVVLMNRSTLVDETKAEQGDKELNQTMDVVTQKQYNQILDQVNNQQHQITTLIRQVNAITQSVNNIKTKQQTTSDTVKTVQNNISILETSSSDHVEMINAQKEEIAYLRSALDVYKYEGVLCKKKGLIVSGASKYIPDAQINTSSMFDASHGPNRSRLYTQSVPAAWCPSEPNADYEWLQFDLGQTKVIYGVVTRGRADYDQWVTSYKVQTSNDWVGDDNWTTYTDVIGLDMVFSGNADSNTPVTNMLWQPVKARYIRFVPITANRNKCMRADVIGCLDNDL